VNRAGMLWQGFNENDTSRSLQRIYESELWWNPCGLDVGALPLLIAG